MALITVSTNPYSVVSADTNDNTISFGNSDYSKKEVMICVTTGSIQFCLNAAATNGSTVTTSQGWFVLTIDQGDTLHFKAATTGDTFVISR